MSRPPLSATMKIRILQRGLAEGLFTEGDLGWTEAMDLFAIPEPVWMAAWEQLSRRGAIPQNLVAAIQAELGKAESLEAGGDLGRFPSTARHRYEPLAFLGAGGMGSVFRARDLHLGRDVAIKVLRHLDEEGRARFLQESRVQANIQHPHILPIHEAGEFEGEPYLAMPLVTGMNLKEATLVLSLEEKARVIRDAAEGLHACHRQGILHRDIKPANILLDPREDGTWHAYLMDFGLARGTDQPRHTQTGLFMGTPTYLSPEQAKGDTLDRRSDIYALGTTLYELLCGTPPFTQADTWELLRLIAQVDPDPIQKRMPDLPRDLALIVGKAMEKDPARRYDSARAFAEDLSRFLDGDPVLAQPPTLRYRTLKLLRKNRSLAWVCGVSLLLVAGLGAYGVRTTLRTRTVARLSEHFGGEAERMETILFRAYSLPLHDTRAEREDVRQRMGRLEDEIAQAGPWARGPGHLALGRGHLALGRLEEARRHLEIAQAWAPGDPRVVQALGQTLALLYRSGMEGLRAKARQERAQDLETSLRQPALQLLRQSLRGDAGAAYAEALIALLEDRPDQALSATRRAQRDTPWLHQAWVLEGDLRRDQANIHLTQGQFDAAEAEFQTAGEAYQKAIGIARSAPAAYLAEAHRRLQLMNLQFDQGRLGEQDLALALEALAQARMTDPDGWQTYTLASGLHRQWALRQATHGQDALPALEASIREARAGLAIYPDQGQLLHNLGTALRSKADVEFSVGKDPRPTLNAAIETLERALPQPRYKDFILDNLGNCHANLALYELLHGLDPMASAETAARCLEESQALKPWVGHVTSLGWVRTLQAQYQRWRGADGSSFLAKGEAAFGEALRLNANSYRVHLALAELKLEQAQATPGPGLSATDALTASALHLQRVDKLRPDLPEARLLWARQALQRARQGDASALREGFAHLTRPPVTADPTEAALLQAQLALEAHRHGQRQHLAPALGALGKALDLRPGEARLWFLRGRLEAVLGRRDASLRSLEEAYRRNANLRHLQDPVTGTFRDL